MNWLVNKASNKNSNKCKEGKNCEWPFISWYQRPWKAPMESELISVATINLHRLWLIRWWYMGMGRRNAWRSGESTRLPPMWLGIDFRTRRNMWVEFVVGSLLCSERFFSGYSGFPLSSKINISKFDPGAYFAKVPKTFRARKANRKPATCFFCKAAFFICCKGNKN